MKPIYKPTKPYTEDINDLVEKGRGPDKQKRKSRGSGDHKESYEQGYGKIIERLKESHGLPITSDNHQHIRARAKEELTRHNRAHGKPDNYEPPVKKSDIEGAE